jgi:hypothetical protein
LGYVKARTLGIAQDEHTKLVMMLMVELKRKAPKFYEHFFKNEEIETMIKEYGIK